EIPSSGVISDAYSGSRQLFIPIIFPPLFLLIYHPKTLTFLKLP
ncbi:MAG: hypothetical protein ACI974_000412, partial [Paraglaciecola sp.]